MTDSLPAVPAQQLALNIFEEYGIAEVRVTDVPVDFGYSKSEALINLADLGLMTRKAINAIHFIASEDPFRKHWDCDVGYFKWLANIGGTRNDKHVRQALREAQKAAIQVSVVDAQDPAKDIYGSVPLLGTFVLARGRLNFKLPEEISRLLKKPTDAVYLSLRIGGAFSSGYALGLYERLLQVRDAGGTEWMPIDEVREWFKATDKKSLQEYKFFKRDVLKPAVEQINDISDIFVTIEEQREKRRVVAAKFDVRSNPKFARKFSPAEQEMRNLYDALTNEFGLTTRDIDEIMDNREVYSNRRLEQVIELVRVRHKKKPIARPANYFMKMLREGVVLSDLERETLALTAEAGRGAASADAKQKELKKKVDDNSKANVADLVVKAQTVWRDLSEAMQTEVWQAFAKSLPGKVVLKKLASYSAEEVPETLFDDDRLSPALASFLLALKA